jgi:dihydrofolate synthase/folylpolyglutamate synthase
MPSQSYKQLESGLSALIGPVKFSAGINLKLERIALLLELLGNPHTQFASIHVGGTSGKGSTATMTAAILQSTGLKTGLHTSPHLQILNERHQINGKIAPTSTLLALFAEMEPLFDEVDRRLPFGKPSYFEVQFALSCLWFARERVDVAVIEVGLGGRLDATNVVPAQVAVITSIGLDHTEILGDTIAAIAADKAGIIKSGQSVFTAATQDDARAVIDERCRTVGASFNLIETVYEGALPLHLDNDFQRINAACAVAAAQAFLPTIDNAQIANGLAQVRIPGRMEIVQDDPLVVLDGAHNPDKMRAAVAAIGRIKPARRRIVVLAMKRGKDVANVLSHLLPLADGVVCTEFLVKGLWHPLSADELTQAVVAHDLTLTVWTEPDPLRAIDLALSIAEPDDLIWITGSLYLIGDVRERWFPSDLMLESAEKSIHHVQPE